MEVEKTADAVSFALLDSHSFYSHSQKVLKCLSSDPFPSCEAQLSFFGRDGRFSCKPKLRTQGSEKASVESSQVRDTQIFEAGENLWRLTGADADGKHGGT